MQILLWRPIKVNQRFYSEYIDTRCVHGNHNSFIIKNIVRILTSSKAIFVFFSCFLESDFCRFCVAIRFFHPRHNGQWPSTSKDFHPDFIHYIYLNSSERANVSIFNVRCQIKGNYWYHFYNVFGMTLSLTGGWTLYLPHSKAALYN